MADDYKTAFDQVQVAPPPALPLNVQLLQIAYGFAPAQAVYTAAKIGLADELSNGPRSSAEVAAALHLDPERTHRLMRGLAHYDFSTAHTIVDVGGGSGFILANILLAHPPLQGVLLDIATDGLDMFFESSGLGDRVQVVTADFFKEMPAGADIYLMTGILHN